MKPGTRLAVVAVFAIAMAWVESAVVFYLRTLVDRLEPYQPNPLPLSVGLGWVELGREFATLVMLATAGILAGQTWRSRLGHALAAFGIWDIFYYVFLRAMCGWPKSLLDWDVLFLIPLPWWGPVLAPMMIALSMVVGGGLLALGDSRERPLWPPCWALALHGAGVALTLYVFMADAIAVLPRGPDAVRNALPERFPWPLFLIAWLLYSAPVVALARSLASANRSTRNVVPEGLEQKIREEA